MSPGCRRLSAMSLVILSGTSRYEEHMHNCYTYALTFINCVLSAQKKQQMNKSEFTEKFVIPRTKKASKYITIYKEICKNGFYAVDHPAQEGSTSTGTI
ncbi:MKRN2 opposite strand protein [Varanus komodoensis]|nr:MKRN2 opposite strand protein [Varanus komodoensis]